MTKNQNQKQNQIQNFKAVLRNRMESLPFERKTILFYSVFISTYFTLNPFYIICTIIADNANAVYFCNTHLQMMRYPQIVHCDNATYGNYPYFAIFRFYFQKMNGVFHLIFTIYHGKTICLCDNIGSKFLLSIMKIKNVLHGVVSSIQQCNKLW